MPKPIARRLRNILIRERLNPADVARCLGGQHRDVVAVRNWLSGRNEPNMRNLLRLSTALDVEPMEFIKQDDPGSIIRSARSSPHKILFDLSLG